MNIDRKLKALLITAVISLFLIASLLPVADAAAGASGTYKKPAWTPKPTVKPAWTPKPTVKPAWTPKPTYTPVTYGLIKGLKFSDVNRDGKYQPGEPGVKNVRIELYDQYGKLLAYKLTGNNGYYEFKSLKPGYYWVKEVLGLGVVNTTPIEVYVKVNGNGIVQVCFGNAPLVPNTFGNVTGIKYLDTNMNGYMDQGEDPMPGVWFQLWNGSTLVREVCTNVSGWFLFSDVRAGNYCIKELVPTGYVNTTPCIVECIIVEHQTTGPVCFGNIECGSIWGYKFFDMNSNGIKDNGEIFLSNVTVCLYANDVLIESCITDSQGCYYFNGLYPDEYEVREVLPQGWVNTTRTSIVVDVWPGRSVEVDFGNVVPGRVWGIEYNDTNGNGIFDNNESGVAGATITIYNISPGYYSGWSEVTTTDEFGYFSFEYLVPGLYFVSENVDPSLFTATTPQYVTISVWPLSDIKVMFGNMPIEPSNIEDR